MQSPGAEFFGLSVDGTEKGPSLALIEVGRAHILPKIKFKAVVAEEFVILAAFLQQSDPKSVLFRIYVLDVQRKSSLAFRTLAELAHQLVRVEAGVVSVTPEKLHGVQPDRL